MKVKYIKKSDGKIDPNIAKIYVHVLKYGYSIRNGWKDKTGVVGLVVYDSSAIRRTYILYPEERIVTTNEQ